MILCYARYCLTKLYCLSNISKLRTARKALVTKLSYLSGVRYSSRRSVTPYGKHRRPLYFGGKKVGDPSSDTLGLLRVEKKF